MFQILEYCILQHNQNMRKALMFDCRHGGRKAMELFYGCLEHVGSFRQMHNIQVFLMDPTGSCLRLHYV